MGEHTGIIEEDKNVEMTRVQAERAVTDDVTEDCFCVVLCVDPDRCGSN